MGFLKYKLYIQIMNYSKVFQARPQREQSITELWEVPNNIRNLVQHRNKKNNIQTVILW